MQPLRILLVEDDDAIATGLVRVLDSQGLAVQRLARGAPAPGAVDDRVGLVILDLGLPDADGIDICRRLRTAWPGLAILILSARDRELDVVAGLDAGADDYLVKPFRLSELLARVRAHLRRVGAGPAGPPPPPLDSPTLNK
jgi:DNA-binding response OmpR family regulator